MVFKSDRIRPLIAGTVGLAVATVVATSDSAAQGVSVKEAVSGWDLILTSHLLGFKNFPKEAKIKNENGTVYLQFTIDRDGHLLDSRIARSSCYDDLDEEGLATVRRTNPYPPFPIGIMEARATFIIPIIFNTKRNPPEPSTVEPRAGCVVR
jgi:protein TonB